MFTRRYASRRARRAPSAASPVAHALCTTRARGKNAYLPTALALVSLLALGLLVVNFRTQVIAANVKLPVVRIDEVGRAEAVQYDASSYASQAPELRYFLTRQSPYKAASLVALTGLLLAAWLAGELTFPARCKAVLFRLHGTFFGGMVLEDVQFPDFRIEYERSDGRHEVENVDVRTVDYTRVHASPKLAAGFTRCRGSAGRVGASSAEGRGGRFNPNAGEELLLR